MAPTEAGAGKTLQPGPGPNGHVIGARVWLVRPNSIGTQNLIEESVSLFIFSYSPLGRCQAALWPSRVGQRSPDHPPVCPVALLCTAFDWSKAGPPGEQLPPMTTRYSASFAEARCRSANAATFARLPHILILHHMRAPFLLVS